MMPAPTLKEGDTLVFTWNERTLVVKNRLDFEKQVLSHLDEAGIHVIDFSHCGYIDSSAWGVILRLSMKMSEQGKKLKIAGLTGDARELFDHMKLGAVLDVVE
ncbi:MAG: STAS domain-containing protein [Candidatus Paceibacterota bacterium]